MKFVDKKLCSHFGQCGGCRFQDVAYPDQLRRKEEICREYLAASEFDPVLKPIVPSPQPYYYRNKMEFTIAGAGAGVSCGLHRRGTYREVVDLRECLIFSEDAPLLLEAMRGVVRESGLPPYDIHTHRGFWRNLVVREGKFTDQIMINLVTTSDGRIDRETLKKRFLDLPTAKKVTSLIRTVNDSYSDAVVPEDVRILAGNACLEEKIEGLSFKIAPYSFFQVNPAILPLFWREFQDLFPDGSMATALDLFCGIGPIAFLLSRRAGSVIGIEMNEEAVAKARLNAGLNGVTNVEFFSGPTKNVLLDHREEWRGKIDLAVVNPPRAGISKKVVKRLKEIAPPLIVYSSCNPKVFFSEAARFSEDYELISLQPFDFFPHTPHMEVLALFKRK